MQEAISAGMERKGRGLSVRGTRVAVLTSRSELLANSERFVMEKYRLLPKYVLCSLAFQQTFSAYGASLTRAMLPGEERFAPQTTEGHVFRSTMRCRSRLFGGMSRSRTVCVSNCFMNKNCLP